ncbi:DedA family protein [Mobilicoccus caccae]|uniref:Membrane protein DedA, SNARE-associated domain n=1 Tax=Mobilicoccus caccae TaxID=1859295 RepID=A0ABQ6IT86_9MICO|nr:VTT domain-containing protein [Mobilicoccus caccae]GMA41153.1 hypothetical protein GCM10025883_31980 [Mobilicoccus caccae]
MTDDEDRPTRPTPDPGQGPAGPTSAAAASSTPSTSSTQTGATRSTPAQPSIWPEDYTPDRADYICLTLLAISGVYGIGVMLARPILLGYNPLVLAGLSGSRSALVTIGALFGTDATSMTVVITAFVIATLSLIKLDLLFWWAGHLWGDFFVQSLIGDSKRRAKQAARAESLARRYSVLAIIISNIPVLPIPKGIVFAVLGVSGASFRKIFVVDLLAAAVVQATWLYLGYSIGEPVVQVVEVIARYSLWISLAILVVVIVTAMRKSRSAGKAVASRPAEAAPGEAAGEQRD